MGLWDALYVRNFNIDPEDIFDRTNIGSGVYQVRRAITSALRRENPYLENNVFSAIALWTSHEHLATSGENPTADTIARMRVKIYFRVPIIHANLPLPSTFRPGRTLALSKLKPEQKNALLISCHPYLFADASKFSSVVPGDQIQIRFDDKTYSSAKIIKIEKKSLNEIAPTDFDSSVKDLFNDAGETAILGAGTAEPTSPEEIKAFAASYDTDDTIPDKEKHSAKLNAAHVEMIPYIKAFIYRSWSEKKIRIQINSTYRTPAAQKDLLDKYNLKLPAYEEELRVWEEAGSPEGLKPEKPPGKPSTTSWHLAGGALDFNAYTEDGTKYGKTSPHSGMVENRAAWKATGIPAIGESLGLRWGGHWDGNYDPIHFDLGEIFTSSQRAALLAKASSENLEPRTVPFV